MHILITGVAGFIGYHLALALKARGDKVVGCDNFNSYYEPRLKRERAQLLEKVGISVIEGDICDSMLLEKMVGEHGITHCIHLAAQAGVRYSIDHPESYLTSNLDGFFHVIEMIRRHPEIGFIYASSSSVYGLNHKIPFSEEDRTETPCSLYGATKKSNELIAHAYHQMHGIRVTGLRYFTVYGPWGRPDMAYFSFTKAILEGRPIQLYDRGTMKRDFTYIDDIVRGTIAALDLGAACEIFNLGNHQPQSVLTLIELIERFTGKKSIKKFFPLPPGEVPITYADLTKSHRELAFTPQISLEDGIKQFIHWYIKKFL